MEARISPHKPTLSQEEVQQIISVVLDRYKDDSSYYGYDNRYVATSIKLALSNHARQALHDALAQDVEDIGERLKAQLIDALPEKVRDAITHPKE